LAQKVQKFVLSQKGEILLKVSLTVIAKLKKLYAQDILCPGRQPIEWKHEMSHALADNMLNCTWQNLMRNLG